MVQFIQMNALVDMLADVKYALRRFNKSPGFTATAVVTLALGIGATTAIFTLIQQVMLRSLAVAQPDQLWRIGDSDRCCFSNGYTQGNDGFLPQNNWNFFSGKRTNTSVLTPAYSRTWRRSRSVKLTPTSRC